MKLSSPIAEICGALIGDGWIESRGGALYLCGNMTEDKDYYDHHMGGLFSTHFKPIKLRYYPYWSVYGFHIYNKQIIHDILGLGVPKGRKASVVAAPEWIFTSLDNMKSFLKGVFDTDGSFTCKKCYGKYDSYFRKNYHCQPRIEFRLTSKGLIEDLSAILEKLGLSPESIKKRKGGLICGKNCKDSYLLRLNRIDHIKKWFDLHSLSSNPKHLTKYLIWKKFGFCPPNTTIEERKLILSEHLDPYNYYNAGARI